MLFTAFLFLFKKNSSSQNLVINGNFERYNALYCNGAGFDVTNWSTLSSPDYFTTQCSNISGGGVPKNDFGYAYPKSGNAYTGLGTLILPYETKEYIYQHLMVPLVAGKVYYTSFYLAKLDRTRIATKKIGVYFSVPPPTAPGNTYVNAIPQVENQSGFLTDTINWVEISGYFKAQGGEEYITIGNFNSNANTDTLYTGTSNPFIGDVGNAYYYIDSVSLYDSLDYVTGIYDIKKTERFSLFPNPNNGSFNLEYKINTEAEFVITDITGRIINHYILFPSQNNLPIKEEELKAGIYFYHILVGEKTIKTDKIVIIK